MTEHETRLEGAIERIRLDNQCDHLRERSSIEYFKTLGKEGPMVCFDITPLRSDAFIIT
jgi:hypothetical protein